MLHLQLAIEKCWQTESQEFLEQYEIMRNVLQKQLGLNQSVLYSHRLTNQCMKQCDVPVSRDNMFQVCRSLDG